jgi:hypothetical protein
MKEKDEKVCVRCKHSKSEHLHKLPYGCTTCNCLFYWEKGWGRDVVIFNSPLRSKLSVPIRG